MTTVQETASAAGSRHRVDDAARALYDAEIALHIARQTGVDHWVSAAYEHLHRAVLAHAAARAG
jgi:hypothetical protein